MSKFNLDKNDDKIEIGCESQNWNMDAIEKTESSS